MLMVVPDHFGTLPFSTTRRVARYARFVATTGRIPLSGTTLPRRAGWRGQSPPLDADGIRTGKPGLRQLCPKACLLVSLY